jgi:hypothetical protein
MILNTKSLPYKAVYSRANKKVQFHILFGWANDTDYINNSGVKTALWELLTTFCYSIHYPDTTNYVLLALSSF